MSRKMLRVLNAEPAIPFTICGSSIPKCLQQPIIGTIANGMNDHMQTGRIRSDDVVMQCRRIGDHQAARGRFVLIRVVKPRRRRTK